MIKYIEYLESNLGDIKHKLTNTSSKKNFQILYFEKIPFDESATIITAGLSGHLFTQRNGSEIRQEIIACTYMDGLVNTFASLLDIVAEDVLKSHQALQRGQILGPAGSIVPHSSLEALLCSNPWYWNNSMFRFDDIDPPIIIVWLIPITRDEASFVRKKGIDEFENIIYEKDPDLLDLHRKSIIT